MPRTKVKNYDKLISESMCKIDTLQKRLSDEKKILESLMEEKQNVFMKDFVNYMEFNGISLDYVKKLVEEDLKN